ncbi:MAG: SLC13 family permease [Candidatus Bipolaricaulia bacterium]
MHFLKLITEERWLFIGLLIGLIILALPTPEGLTPEGKRVLVITAVATLLFITEPIPLPAIALLIVIFQVVMGIGEPTEVARSFMSDSVFFIMGSLMIAVALVKQKLDRRIAWWIFRMTGPKISHLVFGITAISALLASFIGEHTVAAMMLPVGITIVTLVQKEYPHKGTRNLAVLLMLSIAYGCSIAGLGTPSGGARNAIMLNYWDTLFNLRISYSDWIRFAYPMVLLLIPVVTLILTWTIKPEVTNLKRTIVDLRRMLRETGRMTSRDWLTITIFLLTLLGWITLSGQIGLGITALIGASLYLIFGLVKWEELNSGVNWGVVLLYAAAISLGFQMKETGAASWLADTFLGALAPLHITHGIPLGIAASLLTIGVTNTMSNGAAVAVLGPITLNMAVLSGDSIVGMGFITAISSAFAYLTVVGTPAAAIVYSSGYLVPSDFLRVGYKMVIASVLILILFSSLYWPLIGLPR